MANHFFQFRRLSSLDSLGLDWNSAIYSNSIFLFSAPTFFESTNLIYLTNFFSLFHAETSENLHCNLQMQRTENFVIFDTKVHKKIGNVLHEILLKKIKLPIGDIGKKFIKTEQIFMNHKHNVTFSWLIFVWISSLFFSNWTYPFQVLAKIFTLGALWTSIYPKNINYCDIIFCDTNFC